MNSRLSVPELSCPFPDEISPLADAVERHVVDWASASNLPGDEAERARLALTKVGRLAARTTPHASRDALELLADWQMWLFLFDDRFSDESVSGADLIRLSRLVTAFMLVLDNPGEHAHRGGPFSAALGDIVDRLMRTASAPQASRFIGAVRGYFLAQFWEAAHRAEDRPAGVAEYAAMRRHSGAVPTCMALIDVAEGFELPGADFWRPEVRELSDIAVNVTCWANDILSFGKEAERSLKVHSLPAVLAEEQQLDLTDAISAAVVMHDAEVQRYLRAEARVRPGAGPALACYLDGLRSWMAGNYYWSLETGRYNVLAAPACCG
jgi:Terpene synthase family 2, C-terminal metal binding